MARVCRPRAALARWAAWWATQGHTGLLVRHADPFAADELHELVGCDDAVAVLARGHQVDEVEHALQLALPGLGVRGLGGHGGCCCGSCPGRLMRKWEPGEPSKRAGGRGPVCCNVQKHPPPGPTKAGFAEQGKGETRRKLRRPGCLLLPCSVMNPLSYAPAVPPHLPVLASVHHLSHAHGCTASHRQLRVHLPGLFEPPPRTGRLRRRCRSRLQRPTHVGR